LAQNGQIDIRTAAIEIGPMGFSNTLASPDTSAAPPRLAEASPWDYREYHLGAVFASSAMHVTYMPPVERTELRRNLSHFFAKAGEATQYD
jgi:hypothetical protein